MNVRISVLFRRHRFHIILSLAAFLIMSGSLESSQVQPQGKEADVLSPYVLIGVVVLKDSPNSVAVLKNSATGEIRRLSAGESILGVEIIQVANDGILFKKGTKVYWNLLKESSGKVPDSDQEERDKVEASDREQIPAIDTDAAVSLPDREYVRSDVEKRIERERLMIIKETSVAPNYVNGQIVGFKVAKLPKEGIASEVGICEGDIIREVNGVELNSLTAVIEFYRRVYTDNRFEMLIERDGKLVRQVYVLK